MFDLNNDVLAKDLSKLKKKRGQGEKEDYTPFIYVHEFSSNGESCRSPSLTVGRTHHFFSRLELAVFLSFDLFQNVIDIREQFPLPIEDTLDICKQLGIKHPNANENKKIPTNQKNAKKLSIMTTDLLINFENRRPLAINVKYVNDLSDERTCKKNQIEKAYWKKNNVDWMHFTERQVNRGLQENIPWIHDLLIKNKLFPQESNDYNYSEMLTILSRILSHKNHSVTSLCSSLDDQYQVEPGFHIGKFRFATATRLINAPLNKPFYEWKTEMIKLTPFLSARRRTNAS